MPPDPTTDKPTDKPTDAKPSTKAKAQPEAPTGVRPVKLKARYYAPRSEAVPCTVTGVYDKNPSVAASLETDEDEIADVVEWDGKGPQPGCACWVRA